MPIGANLSLSSSSTGSSITDKAAQLLSNVQSKFKRRDAIIRHRIVFGHKFEVYFLKEPTICSQCKNFIYIFGQTCKLCKLTTHTRCIDLIVSSCNVANTNDNNNDETMSKHQFENTNYFKPTFCDHCGIMLKGLPFFNDQGLECKQCGVNVHFGDCKEVIFKNCSGQRGRIELKLTNKLTDNNKNLEEPHCSTKVCMKDFEIIRLLGQGSSSKVYQAKFKLNQQDYAIKVIKKTNLVVNSDPVSAMTEMRVLQLGRQFPFLTIAHCCFQSEDRLFYVMEHVVGKDLVYHLSKARKFTEDRTRFYAAEIVSALEFLHKQGVVYRDLKLDNIILDKQGHCKLLDFGLSKELIKTSFERTRTFCGTPSYISPEIIKELDYDYSVDWWSLGVLIFEMLVGYSPFETENEEELYKLIIESEVKYPLYLSDEARSLIESLLIREPHNRLGCRLLMDREQEIFLHPFFQFKLQDGSRAHQWDEIATKQIRPPSSWNQLSDDNNYDDDGDCSDQVFPISLSPLDSRQLEAVAISQSNQFGGFSFYSESFEEILMANN